MKVTDRMLRRIIREEMRRGITLNEHNWKKWGIGVPHSHALDQWYYDKTGDRSVGDTVDKGVEAVEDYVEEVVDEYVPEWIIAAGTSGIRFWEKLSTMARDCLITYVAVGAALPAIPMLAVIVTPAVIAYSGGAIRILWQYDRMKREADVTGSDKYFHFLGFASAARYLKRKGLNDTLIRYILETLSNSKEFLDFLNCIGGSDPLSLSEWHDDASTNRAGINAGLGDDDLCSRAKAIGLQGGMSKTSDAKSSEFWRDNYSWAWEEYPDIYTDDSLWIQPRYNCSLTKEQREDAWSRHGNSGKPNDMLMSLGPLKL